jgi:hypothetical protein
MQHITVLRSSTGAELEVRREGSSMIASWMAQHSIKTSGWYFCGGLNRYDGGQHIGPALNN